MSENGIYIGKDIEVAIINKYALVFIRSTSKNFLETSLLKRDILTGSYFCIGICRSTPASTEMNSRPKHWEYAFTDRQKVHSNNRSVFDLIGKPIVRIEYCENGIQIYFQDSTVYSASQDEHFTMADIHPEPPDISQNNIGECLKYWNMGFYEDTNEVESEEPHIDITINTDKHMYIFQMSASSIYCRAARYATCDKGVVFNQNFRQRKSDSPETYMIEDNRIALQTLAVEESLFETNACPLERPEELLERKMSEVEFKALCCLYGQNGFPKLSQRATGELLHISRSTVSGIEKKAKKILNNLQFSNNIIYWTVSSFTENQIVLNGCQGELYQWNKPDRQHCNEKLQ